jgi:hypothetical protein
MRELHSSRHAELPRLFESLHRGGTLRHGQGLQRAGHLWVELGPNAGRRPMAAVG